MRQRQDLRAARRRQRRKGPDLKLIVSALRCERGGRLVFANLGFEVSAGESLLVSGPNGAGKSSLLRILAGLLAPAAGRIAIESRLRAPTVIPAQAGFQKQTRSALLGPRLRGDGELTLPEISHFIGHLNGVKRVLTASQNIAFWRRYLGSGRGRTDALCRFGLEPLAHIPAGLLSSGQARRLALARLVAAHRPVWLLDEPSVSLDAASLKTLSAVMSEHLRRGGLLIASSHVPLGIKFTREIALARRRS